MKVSIPVGKKLVVKEKVTIGENACALTAGIIPISTFAHAENLMCAYGERGSVTLPFVSGAERVFT